MVQAISIEAELSNHIRDNIIDITAVWLEYIKKINHILFPCCVITVR